MYPGSLEVLYHAEYFPAVMRVALDVLCGVPVFGAAPGGDMGVPDPAPEELGWEEVLGGEALSDSSSCVASVASSASSSPAGSPR